MGKFSGVLLASDFDATLTDSKGNIPKSNSDAIKYFVSQGGKFTVSTGRTKVGFHFYSDELINAPILLGNGAAAYDHRKDEYCFLNEIKLAAFDEIFDLLRFFPDVAVEIYCVNDKVFAINPHEMNLRHFETLKINNYSTCNRLSCDMFPAIKIMLYTECRSMEIQAYLSERNSEYIKYIPTSGQFVEIISSTAGKGAALLQLASVLNIKKENVYAVGDGGNDVDMLKSAEIGFVPISGDKRALEYADKTVRSCDDGAVADVIGYFDTLYT